MCCLKRNFSLPASDSSSIRQRRKKIKCDDEFSEVPTATTTTTTTTSTKRTATRTTTKRTTTTTKRTTTTTTKIMATTTKITATTTKRTATKKVNKNEDHNIMVGRREGKRRRDGRLLYTYERT